MLFIIPIAYAEESMVTIHYGIDGQDPYYNYRLTGNGKPTAVCVLTSHEKTVSVKSMDCHSELRSLWLEIAKEFSAIEVHDAQLQSCE